MSVRMGNKAGTSRAAESKHDVFINHRGRDVKNTFVAHLYAALKRDGLRPFLDAIDIGHGRHVFNSIDEALKGSRVHVAIFSERYAESKYCLNELCNMLKSGKGILPVFYHVDPVDLRRIENGPFKEGFRKHIEQETEEQILKWREALCKISDYRGLRLDEVNGNEEELVRRILASVRQLMSNVLPGAIEGVEQPYTEAPEEPSKPGDRRLNILVLGDPESVEAVVSQVCGAGRRQTPVVGHVNLIESKTSCPPMCLYGDTRGINRNDFTDIRTFVKVRNEKWHRTKVEALWFNEVHHTGPRNRPALFPESTLRLHMVWFACRNLKDLPNNLNWPEITEILCDLPLQILVIEKQRTQDLDMNGEQEFEKILEYGSDFFPNAQKFMRKLILKVSLEDDNLKEKLWRICWDVKTRVEIGNAAKIIREIRKQLGSAGKSVQKGHGASYSKEVSLARSGEFVLTFLCTYWDIPQDSLRRVLEKTTTFTLQARGSKVSIEPCKFVEFCLIVAAIILYNARDNDKNPKYVCSWGFGSDQLLQKEARKCYNSYFASSRSSLYYDKMVFEDIRLGLERIFEREGWDPRPDRDSFISKTMKLICPRGKSVLA